MQNVRAGGVFRIDRIVHGANVPHRDREAFSDQDNRLPRVNISGGTTGWWCRVSREGRGNDSGVC